MSNLTIHRGYKFRLYPTEEQKILLAKTFGCGRFLYNYFLSERQKFHELNKDKPKGEKRGLNYYDTARMLTAMKKQPETLWLNEAPSQPIQRVLKDLEASFKRFFKGESEYPQFKKRSNEQSCTFPQGFSLNNESSTVRLPKLGPVKLTLHREIPTAASIKFVTVSKTPTDGYYVSFTVEETANPLPASKNNVGVDLGLTSVVTLSTGIKIENPRVKRKSAKKIAFRDRQMRRKKKDSNRRNKARLKLSRTHAKAARQINDFNHKLSRSLVDDNQVIVMENLNVKGMMKNRRLARSIGEVSWGELTRQLQYKSEWAGRVFVRIDRFYASSKTCNCCGTKKASLKLSERFWECSCGAILDRDVNAAVNILEEGLRVLAKDDINILQSGAGLPSDSNQKLVEASRKVVSLEYIKVNEDKRVNETRCPQIHLWE